MINNNMHNIIPANIEYQEPELDFNNNNNNNHILSLPSYNNLNDIEFHGG